jgi:glycosyltransferase involved in cell wall biosynthesis
VFTTCALDATTWADHYPPGTTELNGVTVHRFRSTAGRHPKFDALSGFMLPDPERSQPADQERWIDWQGPVCPGAVDAAAASDADAVVFYPYLYWPTVRGITKVADRAVMHPAAHDEPALRLPIFDAVFAAARGLVLQTDSERRLVEARFPAAAATPQLLLGLGVEATAGDAGAFRRRFGLGDAPYLLCLGRVDDGKGVGLLARFFETYKRRRPGPVKLVFAGGVVHQPPDHPDVVVTGGVDEQTKWGALRGATALLNPSAYEAFSIVLMESWTVGVPTVVNSRCQATTEHVRRSRGGLAFDGYATFEAALDRLVGEPALGRVLGAAGQAYVEENFTWDALMGRYGPFLERVTSGSANRRATPVETAAGPGRTAKTVD